MSLTTFLSLSSAILLWASAFVAIRATYDCYSPEGLAVLRYLIASACMGIFYFRLPKKTLMPWKDRATLLGIGVIGIGIYNISINRGEVMVAAGLASFITSLVPLFIAVYALIFLRERLNALRCAGIIVSVIGVILISMSEMRFSWHVGLIYVFAATFAGSCYTILQKPFLAKYHAIETTTYIIWGGTLFLLMWTPSLFHDLSHACVKSTLVVFYLGIFPASIGYLTWSYGLSKTEVGQAASFLYFMPFITVLIGWIWLNEMPLWLSILGGLFAISGVWLVNRSYKPT